MFVLRSFFPKSCVSHFSARRQQHPVFISSQKARKLTRYYEQTHESLLTKLGFRLTNARTIFDRFIEKNLPHRVAQNQDSQFYSMIQCLSSNKIYTQSNIVPNGRGVLCKAETLYDHDDPMFQAAFREPSQIHQFFVNLTFRGLRNYWISIGLRKETNTNVYSPEDYLACVRAMKARFCRVPIDNNFNSDVAKVASFLTWDKPCLHNWYSNHWDEISKASIFTVQRSFPHERNFRQARMQTLAQGYTHCSIRQSGRRSFSRLVWSQLPLLSNPPADYVYSQIPACVDADISIVYKHLLFLMEIHTDVLPGDIVEFLTDVRHCYNVLQNNSARVSQNEGIRQAAIWLNLDTTEIDTVTPEQLADSVIAADRLCINAVAEPYPFRNTRKFLTPYEKLLKALDVQAVVMREIDLPKENESNETPSDFIAKSYRQLRDQGELLDVEFVADGKSIPAHKLAMASVSAYCKTQFSGAWGQLLAQSGNNTITLDDIKPQSLARMVDFAYDGTVSWTPLPAETTNDQVADRLDEVLDLLQCADMWLMPHLHKITERYLLRHFATLVRIDNVEDVREEARKARAFQVVSECEVFFERNRTFVDMFKDGV